MCCPTVAEVPGAKGCQTGLAWCCNSGSLKVLRAVDKAGSSLTTIPSTTLVRSWTCPACTVRPSQIFHSAHRKPTLLTSSFIIGFTHRFLLFFKTPVFGHSKVTWDQYVEVTEKEAQCLGLKMFPGLAMCPIREGIGVCIGSRSSSEEGPRVTKVMVTKLTQFGDRGLLGGSRWAASMVTLEPQRGLLYRNGEGWPLGLLTEFQKVLILLPLLRS